jgi:uncharacterized protein YyaL (SSP411 family)
MERESFEDEATAAYMNAHFINIKVDREERPDIDHIYMDAVQAMSGSGGWPLNVFLTPDAKPFYGGTYFPPKRMQNRASWMEVLQGVATAFIEKRQEINEQAEGLTQHLVQSNSFGLQAGGEGLFVVKMVDEAADNMLKQADLEWGGFGRAPKFPQTFTIQFLLRYYYFQQHRSVADEESRALAERALRQATLSLDRMIEGGIYDQLGGGFARYSTDTEWLAPHFEKMLYDNALLVTVLSEAYQLTGKARYREVMDETLRFVQDELMNDRFGFLAALDADSEGQEGKFYVWTLKEVEEILQEDAALFCQYYDVSARGNWSDPHSGTGGLNILRIKRTVKELAEENGLTLDVVEGLLARGREKLKRARSKRTRPGLDDKVILGWNALMNSACSRAFMATGLEEYRRLAIRNMEFLLEHFQGGGKAELLHTWKNEQARYPAFLDDYAFLIDALMALQEATGDRRWLQKAYDYMRFILEHFSEDETGYFFYTKIGQSDVIVRKKEVYDGAVPSGNAVMAYNLYRLSVLMDRPEWRERSVRMLSSISQATTRYPTSFGVWACLLQEQVYGTWEVGVIGQGYENIMQDLYRIYIPNRVLMGAGTGDENWPILANKAAVDQPLIYLCKDYVCKQPVTSINRFISLINSDESKN